MGTGSYRFDPFLLDADNRQLRRGDAFAALGAVHLYGERGVLALLERDGYRAVRAS